MSTPASVNIAMNVVSGQLQFAATEITIPVLPANSSHLQIPFPAGLSTAMFAAITSVTCSDLTVQVSTASGSTVLSVPFGGTVLLYNVTAIYLNSVIGGTAQVIIG